MFKAGNYYKFEFHSGVCVQLLEPASETGKWCVKWFDIEPDKQLKCRGLKDVLAMHSGWKLLSIKNSQEERGQGK